jgi:hypothetical protein
MVLEDFTINIRKGRQVCGGFWKKILLYRRFFLFSQSLAGSIEYKEVYGMIGNEKRRYFYG